MLYLRKNDVPFYLIRVFHFSPVSWSTTVKFLVARKFEIQRALALYEQHKATKRREGLARNLYSMNYAGKFLTSRLNFHKYVNCEEIEK